MNVQKWQESGKYFDFQGNKIFYRTEESDNPTLLCLHGFPTSSYDYHKIWDGLAKKFSLIAFDMIGYGFSDKPKNFDYTTFHQVDILQALIEHLKIEKLHILAHDYGNTITQELLARDEEQRLKFEIETICFMNGALFPETHKPILAQKILISPIGFLFGKLIPDSKFRESLASVFGEQTQPTKEEFDDFMYLFQYNGGRNISHKLIQYMSERKKYRSRWVGTLERMKQPFRFINGLEDRVSGKHLVKRFREVLPHQTDIIELEEIGHFPHYEIPDILLKHFLEFHK
jgi:pimeloyl-ACP methyl ester carboxylesterase